MASRCAVVDASGAVINVIIADPEHDQIAGATLVATDDGAVGVGYVWTGAAFDLGPELAAQKAAEEAAAQAAEQAAVEQEAQEI